MDRPELVHTLGNNNAPPKQKWRAIRGKDETTVSPKVLAQLQSKTLKHFEFTHSAVPASYFNELIPQLKQLPLLESVNISHTLLDDSGVSLLAQNLIGPSNSRIISLRLSRNSFGDNGVCALAE